MSSKVKVSGFEDENHRVSGLYPAYRSRLVKVDARLEENRLKLDSHGPGSAIARRMFGSWVKLIEGNQPAKTTEYTLFLSCWLPPIPSDS